MAVSALVLAACLARAGAQERPAPPAYRIIVHPGGGPASVERKFLADAFLKRATRWPNGDGVRPVDQDPESSVRQRFSQEVLGRSVAAVKSYWQQVIFSGRDVPPPELDNDDQVVRYVLKNAGAVGYVSAAADLRGARMLTVR